MTEPFPDNGTSPTIKELLRLVEKNADDRHRGVVDAIENLGVRVDGLQTRVETVAQVQAVSAALVSSDEARRQAADRVAMELRNRKHSRGLNRNQLTLGAIGILCSLALGLLNIVPHIFG